MNLRGALFLVCLLCALSAARAQQNTNCTVGGVRCDASLVGKVCCGDGSDGSFFCTRDTVSNNVYCLKPSHNGDPIFTGFDGQLFEFQGRPNTYWNLLSEKHHTIIGYFTPAVMHDHNGTYITAFGYQYENHRIALRLADDGRVSVELNGDLLLMLDNENELLLRLRSSTKGLGDLTLRWQLYAPGQGQVVTISTPMLTFVVSAVAPGTLDAGGVEQPAYFDSQAALNAPPSGNKMVGILGNSYTRLVDQVVGTSTARTEAVLQPEEVEYLQVAGLFGQVGTELPAHKSVVARRALVEVQAAQPAKFPILAKVTGNKK